MCTPFDFFFFLLHKHFKVSILCVLLHNAFLTRTNMLEEISLKCFSFLAARKPKRRFMFNLWQQKESQKHRGFFCFKRGVGHWGHPPFSLECAYLYAEWEVNDDAAKWEDVINDRPDTSRYKLVDLSMHHLDALREKSFCWQKKLQQKEKDTLAH